MAVEGTQEAQSALLQAIEHAARQSFEHAAETDQPEATLHYAIATRELADALSTLRASGLAFDR